MKKYSRMILRSRSSSKLDPLSYLTDPKVGGTMENAKSRGLFSNSYKIWKYVLAIIVFVSVVYFMTMSGTAVSIEKHRTVRGRPQQRLVTVVMNTFKRHDLMIDAISYYSNCECVKYIHVIWSEKELPPSRIVSQFKENDVPRVLFDIQSIDSLNNRFKPLDGPHTDAIFSVDDDMRVPCSELDLAVEVWRGSQKSLIGFMPRIHLRTSNGLQYRCWWKVWFEGAYSIILTKAALLHHDYFFAYSNTMPKQIRDLVDEKRNCEDIAMQYLIANITSLPPIYVKGHLEDKGALNGISTSQNVVKAGHMHQRDDCLEELEKVFGKDPLVRSHIVVDSAANGWTNSPSTWFEYLSSDLWKW